MNGDRIQLITHMSESVRLPELYVARVAPRVRLHGNLSPVQCAGPGLTDHNPNTQQLLATVVTAVFLGNLHGNQGQSP